MVHSDVLSLVWRLPLVSRPPLVLSALNLGPRTQHHNHHGFMADGGLLSLARQVTHNTYT